MKNILYLITVLTLAFTACTPLEDVYNDLDAQGAAPIVGDVIFTMDDDDYEITDNDDVKKAKSFENYTQAIELIPTVLANKYPVFDKGSSAIVSFSYNRLSSIKNEVSYEMTNTDYTDLGLKYPNFGSGHVNQAKGFLAIKYPNTKRGDLVILTYKFYSGGAKDVVAKFIYTDEWLSVGKELTSTDYTAMQQKYANFNNFSIAQFNIGRYLGTLPEYTFTKKNDIVHVLFVYSYKDKNDVKINKDVLLSYTFSGSEFVLNQNTIKFGHDGATWVQDNTIKYTLTAADYTLIGNGKYKNFDIRSGKDDESVVVRLEKINKILLKNFPSDAEEQKYDISYSVYDGANKVLIMKIIKTGGVYLLQ